MSVISSAIRQHPSVAAGASGVVSGILVGAILGAFLVSLGSVAQQGWSTQQISQALQQHTLREEYRAPSDEGPTQEMVWMEQRRHWLRENDPDQAAKSIFEQLYQHLLRENGRR